MTQQFKNGIVLNRIGKNIGLNFDFAFEGIVQNHEGVIKIAEFLQCRLAIAVVSIMEVRLCISEVVGSLF